MHARKLQQNWIHSDIIYLIDSALVYTELLGSIHKITPVTIFKYILIQLTFHAIEGVPLAELVQQN
jgi:hypothetical protein